MNVNDLVQEFAKLKFRLKNEILSVCKYNQTKLRHKNGEWECDIIFNCTNHLGNGLGKTPEEAFVSAKENVLDKVVIVSEEENQEIERKNKDYLKRWYWGQI